MDLAERTDLDWLHHRQYVAPLETRLRELELRLERYILDEQVRRSQASADRWFTALKVATIVLGLVSWTMLVIALR
jgi:hypothetical protein